MKIQGQELRYDTSIDTVKISQNFNELKANTPKQSSAFEVTISKEGIEKLHNSIKTSAQNELHNSGEMYTDYHVLIGSKLPSAPSERTAESLLKAYGEAYDEIQKGYADGDRETHIAELDKAYQEHVTEFERNNDSKMLKALAEHSRKVKELSGGRAQIASSVGGKLDKKVAEVEKMPTDIGKKLTDAAMNFKVQYGLKQNGNIDITNILNGINIFGNK